MAVANEINKSSSVRAHILEVDRLSSKARLAWNPDAKNDAHLELGTGEILTISEISSIWWRRSRSDQRTEVSYPDAQLDLLNNDWRGCVRGILEICHRGTWVSHPIATERSSNKLTQLAIARDCGFRIPKTLVSNNPAEVRGFIEGNPSGTIVKPVVGTKHQLLFTQPVDLALLSDEAVVASPAIYQEKIDGTTHLRINCFGDYIHCVAINTEDLDWRRDLRTSSLREWPVPEELKVSLRAAMKRLDLEMGVFDLKLTPAGEFVWFEVNPQGQFLFLEGLTKVPLLREFSQFLSSHGAGTG